MSNEVGLVVAVLLLGRVVVVWFARFLHAHRRWNLRRQAYFEQREACPEDDWIPRFVPHLAAHSARLRSYLEAIGTCMEIDWTRLRPDDTFSGNINPVDGCGLNPHPAEDLEIAIEIWFEGQGIRVPRGTVLPDRLDEHLSKLVALSESCGANAVR